ncbi:CAP domain-containing protein [Lentibacillus juripiscarius]|uniref:CAP domain-containing protein n=1 Tax=Lentibacillus juripiscarius TaxID=257446 RepID=A0ABW5V4E8_9BACI
MRLIRIVILVLLVISGVYYLLDEYKLLPDGTVEDLNHTLKQKDSKLETKEIPTERSAMPYAGDIFQWVGKEADALTEKFGKPKRKDLSTYGYEWWVYTDGKENYIQFGIDNNTVKTLYAAGSGLSLDPIQMGQNYDSVKEKLSFSKEVTYSKDFSSFSFQLSDEERAARPLVKVTDNIFMQLYFDTYTNKLTGVRVLTGDILLLHRPYKMKYRGDLPEKPAATESEQEQIDTGMEQQIFHLTNVFRNQHGKQKLKWDDTVRDVAYIHSKDMAENNYFSHYGKDGNGLKERLASKEVAYMSAGENIAAQYPDAQAAMHGWLNSEGHREALLKNDYTHLGTGVYKSYYTQNFVKKQ